MIRDVEGLESPGHVQVHRWGLHRANPALTCPRRLHEPTELLWVWLVGLELCHWQLEMLRSVDGITGKAQVTAGSCTKVGWLHRGEGSRAVGLGKRRVWEEERFWEAERAARLDGNLGSSEEGAPSRAGGVRRGCRTWPCWTGEAGKDTPEIAPWLLTGWPDGGGHRWVKRKARRCGEDSPVGTTVPRLPGGAVQ